MDDYCDTAIVALMLALAVCLTVFFLKVAEPSGGLVELLFPRL
ncbi:MAG TPA: hypothetical protein VGT00_10645 [Methylomirabilota bacterium]|jgi:hypothetical protein|nr:hypothetical protein [Methylomirabilota bacterium]